MSIGPNYSLVANDWIMLEAIINDLSSRIVESLVNNEHLRLHNIEGTLDHSASGLTVGHVMQATGVTTFKFDALGVGSLPAHDLLSASHGDTLAGSPILGDIVFGNATPKWDKLAGNTTLTRKFLRQTGTGVISDAPVWDTLLTTDIPDLSATYQPRDTTLDQLALLAPGTGFIKQTPSGTFANDAFGTTTQIPFMNATNNGFQYNANFTSDGTLLSTQNLHIPTTSATVGIIFQNSLRFIHTFGTFNLFVGREAGNLTTSGTGRNVGIGYNTLVSNTTGANNMAIGIQSLQDNTVGVNNVAIGTSALENNVDGNYNMAIGHTVLFANVDGEFNVGIGTGALAANVSGDDNLAIGSSSLGIATGSFNVAIGSLAGGLLTTGASNIFIGYNAGYNQTTLSGRLIVDNQLRASAAEEITNSILYGVMAALPANQTLRVNGALYVLQSLGINVTPPDFTLHIKDGIDSAGTEFAVEDTTATQRPAFFLKNDAGNRAGFFFYGSNWSAPTLRGHLRIYVDGSGKTIIDGGGDLEVNANIVGTKSTSQLLMQGTGSKLGVRIASPVTPVHFYEDSTGTSTSTGVTIENDGTGDALLQFLLTGLKRYYVGIDNSDSDKFKIGTAALGTADILTIDSTGLVGIKNNAPTAALDVTGEAIVNNKCKLTSIGGYAIKLTNRTGGNTVAGQLVKADTATDDGVILTAASDDECFGVFLDSGITDGAEAWVVVAGIADVAMADNTAATHGNWVETSTEAGYADATSASPAAAPQHFGEIGHCIESVAATGAGTHIMARCVLHFN